MDSIPLFSLTRDDLGQHTDRYGHLVKRKPLRTNEIAEGTGTVYDQDPHAFPQYQPLNDEPEIKYGTLHDNVQELKRTKASIFWLILGDISGILVWLAALAYACSFWYANGKLVSSISFDARSLVDSTRLASTLFTVIFAATTARSLRNLVLWLLERGHAVVMLDRLLGSTTVGGTVITSITAALWSLSPLGSQAVLRNASITNSTTESQTNRRYLNTSHWQKVPGSGSDGDLYVIAPDNLLNSVLISPFELKMQAQDPWGNPKVPRIEALNTTADTDGWMTVPPLGYLDYSSLMGIPLGKLDTFNNASSISVISTWYWNLDCDPWLGAMVNSSANSSGKSTTNWDPSYNYNYSSKLYPLSPPIQIWTDSKQTINRTGQFCHVNPHGQSQLYGTEVTYCAGLPARQLGFIIEAGVSSCRFNASYVDSEVHCTGTTCSIQRMRRSTNPDIPPSNWTILDAFAGAIYPSPFNRFLLNLVDAFASRATGSGGSSALYGYMTQPRNPFTVFGAYSETTPPHLTNDTVTQTLAQVLNTYWISNLGAQLISGDWGQNLDGWSNKSDADDELITSAPNTSTLDTASITLYAPAEKFICNKVWLICFTLTIFVALGVSIAGLVLNLLCQGPRIAFNITTMTRDNRYIASPSVQRSYLDDDDGEMLKLMANESVRLGDVRPDHEVGHIAIGSLNSESLKTERLRKRRLYD